MHNPWHYPPIMGTASMTDREADLVALVRIWNDHTRSLADRRAALDAADALAVELARGERR